jgi:anthranilate synthase component 1
MLYPSLDNVTELLSSCATVPVFASMLMDCRTPVGIFSALKSSSENCFLLESVENSEKWGRYSFIGVNPQAEITIRNGEAVFAQGGNSRTEKIDDPAAYLNSIMEEYRAPNFPDYPRFTGGLVGYFGFDMLRYLEKKLGPPPEDDLHMADCVLHLYDEVIAFDHISSRIYVILNINRKSDAQEQYAKCEKRAEELFGLIQKDTPPTQPNKPKAEISILSNVSEKQFAEMVNTAKQYIFDGDIFQVVLSHRFEIENPPDSFDVYRVLRATNPSPYLYYFQGRNYQIAGASPEMLVKVTNGAVINKPIAGTSRRGKDEAEDKKLEHALLSDEKERAEHTMLVDLGRNDVGRVCKFGTVEVTDFMHVERCSKVMHLVSDVHGILQEDKTALDALLSVLPAGTLSGAPKIRAMQIIDELENKKRGVYGGAVGYLGYDGNMDTCITIRTALFCNGKAYVQAGAGIVADSVPENEYAESENKALAVIHAIREAKNL